MRSSTILGLAACVLVACGPSTGSIKTAKEARYKGDKLALFNAAKNATAGKFDIEKADETRLGFETVLRWYNADGLLVSERNGDVRDIPDRAISLKVVVTVLADGDAYVVRVKPMMMRRFKDRPNPDVLSENDPSIPEWMMSKIDLLSVAIHDALAPYEVKSVPGAAPPPTPAPPPDEPPAAPPTAPEPTPAAPPPATP
ncbi:MAG TPA: hypothetical protein VGO00_02515 [Kofleriaceae bacterium]|jgi:hypothetical protein|nr:hypothetical protein [Kofleriaceae bacterium]